MIGKNKAVIVAMALAVTSCQSLKGPMAEDSFPRGHEALCIRQRDAAKAAIVACGTPLQREQAVSVYLHRGTRKINGMWCWEWTTAYYVAGMTHNGTKIEVGCSPRDTEVNAGVVFHEMGHYWLVTNYGDYTHNPKYDRHFHWSGLKTTSVAEPDPPQNIWQKTYGED